MTSIASRRTLLATVVVFCTMAAAYQSTRAPSVTFIDSGELAAVASVLGIAHPTGYPLFTLIGRLVAMLPVGPEEIVRLNVFASLLTAFAVAMMVPLALLIGKSRARSRRTEEPRQEPPWTELASIGAGAFLFGTSTTVWAQSVAAEVYALHLVFLVLVLAAIVAGIREQRRNPETLARPLILAAFLFGLSFSNHLTTVLLVPGVVYLYAASLSLRRPSIIRLGKLAPWFALGISPYLYLLVRSPAGPPLDWGHPATAERFLWHVSGKQYRSWIFSSFESAERQWNYFLDRLPAEFAWPVLALAIAGLVLVWRQERRQFWFLTILFVTCVAYAVNYDIHDIDSYFLLAYVVVAVAATHGLRTAVQALMKRSRGVLALVVPVAALAVAAYQGEAHRDQVDQSDNYLVEDYSRTMLASVDSNAVILTYQWDYFVSASLYLQVVRDERQDVVVIDKELLRRSWYLDNLERRWPWLAERCRSSLELFRRELRKFETGIPYNYEVIESRFNTMINDIIRSSRTDRPVYVGPEIEQQFGADLERVPSGLLFKLEGVGSGVIDPEGAPPSFRPTAYRDRLVDGLRYQCAKMLVFRALWLSRGGHHEKALAALNSAADFSPSMPEIGALRERLQAESGRAGTKE